MNERFLLACVLSLALLMIGCAESEDPTEYGFDAHPATWYDPASEDFHGAYVRNVVEAVAEFETDERTGTEGCASCHGDLGLAEGDQCLRCHAVGASNPTEAEPWIIHPSVNQWLAPQSENFHARVISDLRGSQECTVCHGLQYDGGWTQAECQLCHPYSDLNGNGLWNPHPGADQWYDSDSPDFHGRAVELRGAGDCKECHNEFAGQNRWAGVVCAACHAGGASGHPAAASWVAAGDHGVRALASDPVGADCQRCHGLDLTTGGSSGVACNACHTWPFVN